MKGRRLLREQHEWKIHLFRDASRNKLVGAAPAKSVRTGMEINSPFFGGEFLKVGFFSSIYIHKKTSLDAGSNDVFL
ncbi:hypothetical protein CSE16_01900 [Solibacillus sp. R5-41]|nr:hypothetical protein CSE16_01900 [Solibacillus sp. R5-41]